MHLASNILKIPCSPASGLYWFRNYQTNLGNIKCRVCAVHFQSEIHRQSEQDGDYDFRRSCWVVCLLFVLVLLVPCFCSFLFSLSPDLSDPIDVYSEWIDSCEDINKKVAVDRGGGEEAEDEEEREERAQAEELGGGDVSE
jgi:transcription elongation factor Elf1